MSEKKQLLDMSRKEFDNIAKNPINKAVYKKRGRPAVIDMAKPTDRLTCSVCGKEFFRSGRTSHQRTVFHQERAKINKKLNELLL